METFVVKAKIVYADLILICFNVKILVNTLRHLKRLHESNVFWGTTNRANIVYICVNFYLHCKELISYLQHSCCPYWKQSVVLKSKSTDRFLKKVDSYKRFLSYYWCSQIFPENYYINLIVINNSRTTFSLCFESRVT